MRPVLVGRRAGLIGVCVCACRGAGHGLEFAVPGAIVHSPAFASGAGAVSHETVLAGVVHDGFIDGCAVVIVVAASKVICRDTVVDVVFDAVHRADLMGTGHLNVNVLHEVDVFARGMVHVALDEHGRLCGVGRTGDGRTHARHAGSPEGAEYSRAG